ncbi:MAG TPA: DUF2069 domain-containing protein [Arenimonas sp.]|uniref:DUF2069 domain-containing protein n=1 Tax=Arenimonas sp. TaxID=1872635 RepID=UPI002BCEC1F4|nr:DUF2069 domain-containing protein [Arenimonas sp.]HMB55738.1 DUF2069 domain-containing protein [Arenimonas sp.]
MNLSRRYAALGIVALLALQWLWHAWLLPPERVDARVVAFLFSLPILPAAILVVLRHRQAGYWGGIAALLYFCHGISETWAQPSSWPLALTETGLSLWIILAANWSGLRAKLGKSKAAPPNV